MSWFYTFLDGATCGALATFGAYLCGRWRRGSTYHISAWSRSGKKIGEWRASKIALGPYTNCFSLGEGREILLSGVTLVVEATLVIEEMP